MYFGMDRIWSVSVGLGRRMRGTMSVLSGYLCDLYLAGFSLNDVRVSGRLQAWMLI